MGKGFGFIECPATYAQYGRDVFLHKAQIGEMKVGTMVSFTYEVNKQGMPQAKEVRAGMGMGFPGGKAGEKGEGKGAKGAKGEGKGKSKDGKKSKKKDKEKGDREDAKEKKDGEETT